MYEVILFFATGFGMVELGPFATEGEAIMEAGLAVNRNGVADFQFGAITGPDVRIKVSPSMLVKDAVEFVEA